MKGQRILLPRTTVRKEDEMQTPEVVAAMRRLYERGWGLRRIAGELGCSRNTVKRHLGQSSWTPYRSPNRRQTLGELNEWLAASFRQHRGNADVVRQELQRVHGLHVSLRTVERAVRPWRQALEAEARDGALRDTARTATPDRLWEHDGPDRRRTGGGSAVCGHLGLFPAGVCGGLRSRTAIGVVGWAGRGFSPFWWGARGGPDGQRSGAGGGA